MVKLFLAEDEIVMREGIKKHIDWEGEGISFVGEAGDGELAYPMILNLKPDILITDIKMPFMDGLQLSELVKKELPDIHIIILSGYDEFSYAQKAVSLGVSEYLLKPIAPAKLLSAVRKAAEEIEKEHGSTQTDWSQEELEEKRELEKLRLFNAVIMNGLSVPDIINQAGDLGISLTAQYFRVILMQLNVKGEAGDAFSETQNAFRTKLMNYAGTRDDLYISDRGIEGFIMLQTGNDISVLEAATDEAVKEIIALVRETENAAYYFGIGSIVNRMREIRHSYDDANRAFSYRFLTDADKVMYSGSGDQNPDVHDADNTIIDISGAVSNESTHKALDNFLRTGTYDEVKPFFDGIFSSLGTMNVNSVIFLNYLTVDAYFLMIRFLQEIGEEQDRVDRICGDINSTLGRLKTWQDAKEYLSDYLQNVIKLRDSSSAKRYGKILGTTVGYIDSHYADPDISLNDAAAIANMSPNHFSAVFSQEMGITFIEYLIKKRMDRAKELLMTTDIKSSEIAYEVGYKDPHYFSHTFKKTQGVTPKEYRLRGRNEE